MRPRERQLIRRLALVVVCCSAVALLVGESAPTQSTTPFLVGFAEDMPKETGSQATDQARALGATAMRLTTQWSTGLKNGIRRSLPAGICVSFMPWGSFEGTHGG